MADRLAPEYRNMLACVRCGACLTSCPTYVLSGHEAEGPRGRVAMIRAVLQGEAELTPDLVEHELSCLVCDACSAVCPAGVRMEPLQIAFRAALDGRRPRQPGVGLAGRVLLGRMGALRAAAAALRLYQRSGLQWLARNTGLLRLLGLHQADQLLPPIPGRFLRPRGQRSGAGTPVELFAGCIMATALAGIDRATVRVLERAGCEVIMTAGQTCCGALHAHGGDQAGAQELARRNIAAFEAGTPAPVIVNSAGCGAMLKDYGHLLAGDPQWAGAAQAFASRVRDASEFLAERELPFAPLAVPLTAAYQDACHLAHAQGIRQQPRQLLRGIPNLQLAELKDGTLCCGSAGVYNLTHPATAAELQRRKVAAILASGASTVVTANPGCLLQLRAGLAAAGASVEVKHLMEVLDEALP